VDAPNARRIDLEGAVNFRDIGGYPAAGGRRVRWRQVFRSDSLSKLTDADHLRILPLGIRTLIDFRLTSEREQQPNRLDPAALTRTVEIGFITHGTLDMLRAVSTGTIDDNAIERAFVDQYRRFVTDHAPEFSRALAYALDAENLPLVIHCTSGKDRTGFAVCALLLALGTPQERILEDYSLTNSYMRDISHFFGPYAPAPLIRSVMAAKPNYLEAAFEQIRQSFGSVDAYLARALDLDDAKRSRLIELLTVDEGEHACRIGVESTGAPTR
jgi:protein-tyrosine phosphatase